MSRIGGGLTSSDFFIRIQFSRRTPLVALIVVYCLLRAINLLQLIAASESQAATGPPNPLGVRTEYFVHTEQPASPGLSGVLANWDGQWYEKIARYGYPSASEVRSENDSWASAFPPAFPYLVRGFMALTGLGFPAAALVINLCLGLAATLVIFQLSKDGAGGWTAFYGAVAVNCFPSAGLFIVAYSESLALLLVAAALWFIVHRHYALTVICIVLLAFVRPVGAPIALVLIAHAVLRYRGGGAERPSASERIMIGVGVIVAATSPWYWPALSSLLLGEPASTTTGLSGQERTDDIAAGFYFGWFGTFHAFGPLLLAVLILALVLTAALVFNGGRQAGLTPELHVWWLGYSAFVLLVTPVTPSLTRYLLLSFPIAIGAAFAPLTKNRRTVEFLLSGLVLGAFLVLQWAWLRHVYILDPAPDLMPWAP